MYEKLKDLNEQKKKLLRVDVLPMMALKGMPPEFQKAVTDTLKFLPAHHISAELIDRISYSDKYVILDPAKGIPQQAKTVFSVTGEKPIIVINRQKLNGQFVSIGDIKNAVAHEVGHIVYRYILTDEQRETWFEVMNEVYAPIEDPEEDEEANEGEFARAYSAYQLDDSDWQREFAEEYGFFEESDF